MKSFFKSFFFTFIISLFIGIIAILLINFNYDNSEINVSNNLNRKLKRTPNHDDILNILQVISLDNKIIFVGIFINPQTHSLKSSCFSGSQKTSFNNKNLTDLYNYGGVKLLLKTMNNDFNLNFNRYIIIKNEMILTEILEILGNLEINEKLSLYVNKKTNIPFQIIDPDSFLTLTKFNDPYIISNLFKQFYLKKLKLLDSQIGDNLFLTVINKIDTNISFKDFNNLVELDLNFNNLSKEIDHSD